MDKSIWFLEPKSNEPPTAYNVDMLTQASSQLQSLAATTGQGSSSKGFSISGTKGFAEPVQKQKKTNLAVSETLTVDSPAKNNTHRASRKRYYEEVDHDEDSEEEFNQPIEEDNSSNGTVEDTDAAAIMTTATTKAQLKKQHEQTLSQLSNEQQLKA